MQGKAFQAKVRKVERPWGQTKMPFLGKLKSLAWLGGGGGYQRRGGLCKLRKGQGPPQGSGSPPYSQSWRSKVK